MHEPLMLKAKNRLHSLKDRPGSEYDGITWSEVCRLATNPHQFTKDDAPFAIFSDYRSHDGRSFSAQRDHGNFLALAGDIDEGNPAASTVKAALESVFGQVEMLIYSSSRSSMINRKWRYLVPLASSIPGSDYSFIQSVAFAEMARHGINCDKALTREGQAIYLPNKVPGRDPSEHPYYHSEHHLGGRFEAVGSALWERAAAEQRAELERRSRIQEASRKMAFRADARDDGHPIDSFNGAVSLAMVMQGYGYEADGRGNYRSPVQSSKSFATKIIEFNGPSGTREGWVSLSGSDADARIGKAFSGGCYGDAFDLYQHFEHGGDFSRAVRKAALLNNIGG